MLSHNRIMQCYTFTNECEHHLKKTETFWMWHGFQMRLSSIWLITLTKENVRFWTLENWRFTVTNPLHPQRLLCGMHCQVLECLVVFISDPVSVWWLRNECVPYLQEYNIAMNSAWFQQDGTRSHTSKAILSFFIMFLRRESCLSGILCSLSQKYHGTNFSKSKLLCLFLWGYLKDRVFQKNLHAIQKLKIAIQPKILKAFLQELCPRSCTFPSPHKVHELQGHHIEHVSI